MNYQERDSYVCALDALVAATSSGSTERAIQELRKLIDGWLANERKRAAEVCRHLAGEWRDERDLFRDNDEEKKKVLQVREERAKVADMCAYRISGES